MRRLRVGILFGGISREHEISLLSARSVMKAIDRAKYEVVPIGITRQGQWITEGDPLATLAGLEEGRGRQESLETGPAQTPTLPSPFPTVDVVFPLLHGTFGEDGTLQGLLEMAQIPYVGAGVLASALGMDKAMMKMVFRQQGLPVPDFLVLRREERARAEEVLLGPQGNPLGYPCFVKPANGGSSLGITRVTSPEKLLPALEEAWEYDRKALLEEAIQGREIECSVLGNEEPLVSIPGEVVYSRDFYDYEAKYLDGRTQLVVPAPLESEQVSLFQSLALAAFRAIDCCGMARVDFFLRHSDNKVFVSEINTIPGFTPVSMYPRLWEASHISFPELVDRLIKLALERHAQKSRR
jgi:D-alanine-D-alanine ligase